jgi:quercetin dioxygenase-like cupin family protein
MSFIEVKTLSTKEVIPGYEASAIHTGTMSFVHWNVEAGAIMPEHSHLHEQVAHVLEGVFELTVNGETKRLEPGVVAVIPPYIRHGGKAITACRLLDVFLPEREDYQFDQV